MIRVLLIILVVISGKISAQHDTLKFYCPDPEWVDRVNFNSIFYKKNNIKSSKIISYSVNNKGGYEKPSPAHHFIHYNKLGYITKCDYYKGDYYEGGYTYYKYDSLNRIVEEKHTDSLSNSNGDYIFIYSYDSTSGYSIDPHYNLYKNYKINIDTLYNKKHQIIETKDHNYPKSGYKELFFYSKEGKLSKTEFYTNFNSENIHRMNADGTEIKNNGEVKEMKTQEIFYIYKNDLIIEKRTTFDEYDNNPSYEEYIFNKDNILVETKTLANGMYNPGIIEAFYSEKVIFEYFNK